MNRGSNAFQSRGSGLSRVLRQTRNNGINQQQRSIVRTTATASDPLLLRVARGEEAERAPVWLMRQAGRYMEEFRAFSDKYPFRHRSETPDIAIELSLQPWRAFKTDGVIFFSDILTPLPALGVDFDVIKGKGPVISDPLREHNWQSMRPLEDPEGSLPFVKEILSTLRQEIDDETTLLGFVGSPWTLTAYSVEGKADRHCKNTKVCPGSLSWVMPRIGIRLHLHSWPMIIMMNEPKVLHGILEKMTDALVEYVKYQIRSGAQVVQIFDSWAHHLSPSQFAEFSMPYAQQVIDRVRVEYPEVPLIFHANGGVGKLYEMQSCTADVIGLDWSTDLSTARSVFPDKVIQGNVDPMVLFGTEATIRKAVGDCLEAGGPSKHILNVGHGVVQQTPEENVKLFVELARNASVPVH